MPASFRDRALGGGRARTAAPFDELWRDLIEIATALAEADARGFHSERRAACPLCNRTAGGRSSRRAGFRLPDGLRRHLEGSGRARPCAVMHAVRELTQASQ